MIKKLLMSVLAIFGFAFFLSNGNSYAASYELTITQDDLTLSGFPRTSFSPGFGIKSISLVSSSFTGSGSSYGTLSVYSSSSGSLPPLFSVSSYADLLVNDSSVCLSSPINTVYLYKFKSSNDYAGSIVVNFSDDCDSITPPAGTLNITENGTYDVTQYASAVVNIDQTISDLPPYSELVVDSFWKYHVAIAGGLASIFAVFVVYRIIRSRLR